MIHKDFLSILNNNIANSSYVRYNLTYMGKKLTQEFIEALLAKEGYSILEIYTRATVPHLLKCPLGHEYRASIGNYISRNSRCPICKAENSSKRCKTPFETLLKWATEKGATLLTSRGEYEQNHHKKLKVKVLCKCGKNIINMSPNYLMRWAGCCRDCGTLKVLSRRPKKLEYIKKVIEEKGYKLISTEYLGTVGPLILECEKHGQWTTRWGDLKNNHWCRRCACAITVLTQRVSLDHILEFVEKKGYKLLSTEYTCNKTPLIVECSKHGQWKTHWNLLSNGGECPRCSKKFSKTHQKVFAFLQSIYNGQILINDRIALLDEGENKTRSLELDIFIPELKIGIEIDGLYWHSTKKKKEPIKTNLRKLNKCIERGITFLAFFEDEWKNKQEILKSIIKSKIGVIKNKIHARNTKFVEITNKEAKIFLEANHLEGYAKCSKSIGLKYNGQLVMCMTLRKSRCGRHEIARMATLVDHVVVGGASKLLSHTPRPLITYSNNRISNGEVYSLAGFKEITETTKPSYFYTDFIKRVFRTSCMKIKGIPGTEESQAKDGLFSKKFGHDREVYKIYDYGHRKWLKID